MKNIDPRHYDVIVAPVVTEKATVASEHNKVVFKVAAKATKPPMAGEKPVPAQVPPNGDVPPPPVPVASVSKHRFCPPTIARIAVSMAMRW